MQKNFRTAKYDSFDPTPHLFAGLIYDLRYTVPAFNRQFLVMGIPIILQSF